LAKKPTVSVRFIDQIEVQRPQRAESLIDYIRRYEVSIGTGNVRANNYDPQGQEGVVLSITSFLTNPTSISDIKRNDGYGVKFRKTVVSNRLEIAKVILPNNERTAEIKVAIYDNTGNMIYSGNGTTWNLTNLAGRVVANGSYLVIAEAKGASGKVYRYSAKIGVKR